MSRPVRTHATIMLDAGHGGTDPGAVADGVREADIALDYVYALVSELRMAGVRPLLTREDDSRWTLSARASRANELGACCFVSVHCNASTSQVAHGFQVFYARGSAAGKDLAERIVEAAHQRQQASRWTGVFPDESPQCGGRRLAVLRQTRMPAVLVELGFITNPTERAHLLSADRRQQLAGDIAWAIEGWLEARQ